MSHKWKTSAHSPWTYCSSCGVVKNDNDKPCKGKMPPIAVRDFWTGEDYGQVNGAV